jgi:hypothetical protein
LLYECTALGESRMKFRGRLVSSMQSFETCKIWNKFYKTWCKYRVLSFCHNLQGGIFTRKHKCCHTLCEELFNKGHTLYLDNCYTSLDLYRRVADKGTNIVSTIRANWKNMPHNISSKKLKKGEYQIWSSNNILCLKWRDNKDFHFLSSKYETADITTTDKMGRKHGHNQGKK